MENIKNIQVFLSTDGKLTISYGAENIKEADAQFSEATALFKKMNALMNELGLKPQRGGFPPKKEKEWTGVKCPKDQGRLYSATTSTGKKMIKCENSKWNSLTKSASGCDYIEWVNDNQTTSQAKFEKDMGAVAQPSTGGVKMVTPAQINLITKLQGEGRISEMIIAKDLTLDKAKELISSSINK